eukprot:585846-Rhodomonas_salina.5
MSVTCLLARSLPSVPSPLRLCSSRAQVLAATGLGHHPLGHRSKPSSSQRSTRRRAQGRPPRPGHGSPSRRGPRHGTAEHPRGGPGRNITAPSARSRV